MKGEQNQSVFLIPQPDNQAIAVAPVRKMDVNIGTKDDFIKMVNMMKEQHPVVIYSEEKATIMTGNRATIVHYFPELDPMVEMFFVRSESYESKGPFGMEKGDRIWSGEYEAVKFGKMDLINFFKSVSAEIDEKTMIDLKNTKMKMSQEIKDSFDEQEGRETHQVILETMKRGHKKRFHANIKVLPDVTAEMHFEATLQPAAGNNLAYHVILINAREILKSIMDGVINDLPEDVPRLYGKVQEKGESGRRW